MATSFFGGAFFGGEFFSASTGSASTGSGAGKSSKGRSRRWIIGDRVFYGTADEASDFAEVRELPEPVAAPKKKQQQVVAKPRPVDELDPVNLPPLPSVAGLDYGLLNELNATLAFDRKVNEQIQVLRKQALDQDDADVIDLAMAHEERVRGVIRALMDRLMALFRGA